jgi:hypothetical protein
MSYIVWPWLTHCAETTDTRTLTDLALPDLVLPDLVLPDLVLPQVGALIVTAPVVLLPLTRILLEVVPLVHAALHQRSVEDLAVLDETTIDGGQGPDLLRAERTHPDEMTLGATALDLRRVVLAMIRIPHVRRGCATGLRRHGTGTSRQQGAVGCGRRRRAKGIHRRYAADMKNRALVRTGTNP